MVRRLLGDYIVADSEICHGKPTFIGTRIMVWQVLEMVSEGMDWDKISQAWVSKIPKEAIAESIRLATQVFVEHVRESTIEPAPELSVPATEYSPGLPTQATAP